MYQQQKIDEAKALFPLNLNRIITHHKPSIDEIVAIASIVNHSDGKFVQPEDGVNIEFCGPVELAKLLIPYEGDSVSFLVNTGTLIIGMGGSLLDEHEHENNNLLRAVGECAATLAAKLIDFDHDVHWKAITRYALQDDTGKRLDRHYLDATKTLPNLIKAMYTSKIEDEDWVLNNSIDLIEKYYDNLKSGNIKLSKSLNWHLDFLATVFGAELAEDVVETFKAAHRYCKVIDEENTKHLHNLKVCEAKNYTGESVGIALAQTDRDNIQKTVFDSRKDIDVLVVRKESGNVQIYTRTKCGVDLSNTVGLLRQFENILQKRRKLSGKRCYDPGKLSDCGEWFYFSPPSKCDMIFNGSLTAPDVPATKLSNESIKMALVEGIKNPPIRFQEQSNTQYTLQTDTASQPLSANI